jgi:cephalosporin-C deacetylase
VFGIESRQSYEIGHSVADVWCAANALLAKAPLARGRLFLEGGSFGGGIGMLALAWDHRFAKAYFEVPTFGFQVIRTRLPTLGSANAVQKYIATAKHPANVLRTLSYFDAGSAARFTQVPTMIAAARSDAFVAPPGQFAIYNALAAPKELVVMSAGHAEIPPSEARRLDARRRAWLAM